MTTAEVRLFRIALGTYVAKLRDRHNLLQHELAEKLDVSQPTIARIEHGDNGVPAEKYSKLAGVFGMSLDKFHNKVQAIVDGTRRAGEAIKPGAVDTVNTHALRGLVQFVVEGLAR